MVSFYSILFQRVDVAEGGFRLPYNNTPAAAGVCVLGGGGGGQESACGSNSLYKLVTERVFKKR